MKKKVIYLLAIIMLTILAGCNTKEQNKVKNKEEKKNETKGRYEEKKIDLQTEINKVYDVKISDNKIKILIKNSQDELCLYESNDFGLTWNEVKNFSEEIPTDKYFVVSATVNSKNEGIVTVWESDPSLSKYDMPKGVYTYFKFDLKNDTKIEPINLNLPEPNEEVKEIGYGLSEMKCMEDGSLFGILTVDVGEGSINKLVCINEKDGNILWETKETITGYEIYNDIIYVGEQGKNNFVPVDKKTGEVDSQKPLQIECSMFGEFDLDYSNEKIYYCNDKGIFGTDFNNALSEQLLNGSLYSFSNFDYIIRNFNFMSDFSFLIILENTTTEKMELFQYTFNEELSTSPDNQFTIYSLIEDETIKKFITEYHKVHPEILVNYEIGLNSEGERTLSDVISLLNTEILAGNGPDLFVLNGLPYNSYQEKGLLMDFSEEITKNYKDDLYENILAALKYKGKQYTIPIGIKLPLLIGEPETINKIDTNDKFLEYLKSIDNELEFELDMTSSTELIRTLISTNWLKLLDENKELDKEKLETFLIFIKETYERLEEVKNPYIMKDGIEEKREEFTYNNPFFILPNQFFEEQKTTFKYLYSLVDYADIINYKMATNTIFNNTFTGLMTGINKKSEKKELAKNFVLFMLNDQTQKSVFENWNTTGSLLPINKNSFSFITENPTDENMEVLIRANEHNLVYEWPDKSSFAKLEEQINGLTDLAMEDIVVMELMMDHIEDYITDKITIDKAINEITQKVNIYLKE